MTDTPNKLRHEAQTLRHRFGKNDQSDVMDQGANEIEDLLVKLSEQSKTVTKAHAKRGPKKKDEDNA